MTFANPVWLSITPLLVLALGALAVFGLRRREALLSRFAATRLLEQLTEKGSLARNLIKLGCILAALTFIGMALARPQYGVEWTERKGRGLDIVFVVDTSRSMLATDLRPNRLERAKLAIRDLVRRLEGDRVGIVAFAGHAFLLTPPTLDYAAFGEGLEAIDTGILTRGGSDLGGALREAAQAFPDDNNLKVVLLLTDGEDLGGDAIAGAEEVASKGIIVYAIGIGTPEGEYLRIRNERGTEEFVRDADGQPVRTQLDESTLQKVAQLTGGQYTRIDGQGLNALYDSVLATLPREERESELQEIRIERFQWLLGSALFFIILELLIRRRSAPPQAVLWLLVFAMIHLPQDGFAQARHPGEGPQTEEELAGEAETKTRLATPPTKDPRKLYNEAVKAFRAGEYESAAARFEGVLRQTQRRDLQRDALYNLGHTTFQQAEAALAQQDFETALELLQASEDFFRSAHELDPEDAAAREDAVAIKPRRETLQKFLEQQEPPQDSQEDEDSETSGEEDSTESEESQESEGSDQSEGSDDSDQSDQSQGSDESQDSGESESSEGSGESDESEGSDDASSQERPQPDGEEGESDSQSSQEPSEEERDPFEDMQESEAAEAANEEGTEEFPAPPDENSADEAGGDEAEGAAMSEEMIPEEGMTDLDARILLDSLRRQERMLPFTPPPEHGRTRDLRDW